MAGAPPAPVVVRAQAEEESLVIPTRRQPQAQPQKGGWLSMFGGRRPEPVSEDQPMPQFRNANAVTQAKSLGSAQLAEEEEPEDDLEIPSFLRRLAN